MTCRNLQENTRGTHQEFETFAIFPINQFDWNLAINPILTYRTIVWTGKTDNLSGIELTDVDIFRAKIIYSTAPIGRLWRRWCCYANGNGLIYFNNKNDKTKATLTHMYIELVVSKPTTTQHQLSMKEQDKEIANATSVHIIHKRKLSRNWVLEKARVWTFYFKNLLYTDCVVLQKPVVIQSILCVWWERLWFEDLRYIDLKNKYWCLSKGSEQNSQQVLLANRL